MHRLGVGPRLLTLLVVAVVVSAGCAQPVADGGGHGDDGSTDTASPTATGPRGGSTPTEATTDAPATGVTSASKFARVEVGETTQMDHGGRNITLSYRLDEHTASVEVTIGAEPHTVTRNRTTSAETVSWSAAGRRFVLRPVEPVQRHGQTVYLFGEAWNTSHVELEVFCTDSCA